MTEELLALALLDGCYARETSSLREYFPEYTNFQQGALNLRAIQSLPMYSSNLASLRTQIGLAAKIGELVTNN